MHFVTSVSTMYDGYATIKNKYFPKVDHIIDLFHIVIQLNRVTNSIRCSVIKSLPDDSIEKKFMSFHWKLFLCKSSLIPSYKIFTSHKLMFLIQFLNYYLNVLK